MRTVKNDILEKFVSLSCLLVEKRLIKKIVLSKPDFEDVKKSTISPKVIANHYVLQQEIFSKDNKAYHRNIYKDFEIELLAVFESYAQINLVSTIGDAQYMRSKSGKETLIGESKIKNALNCNETHEAKIDNNNKQKKVKTYK